jgi:BirA family biotin operon repressor/biotin-[acetyl-CoA-carboxylase] ligase
MVQRARRLRRDMTDAERLLWSHLRAGQLGAKFRKQMWLAGFIADFASIEAKLVVEVDGGQHDRDRGKDAGRAAAMARLGYRTLRFWNHDVLENIDGVLLTIANALPSPQTPLPERERGPAPRPAPTPLPFGEREGPARVAGGRVRE